MPSLLRGSPRSSLTYPRYAFTYREYAESICYERDVKTVAACLLLTAVGLVAPAARGGATCTWATVPGARWTLASEGGVAWLVTPCGERFYSIGIHGLDGGAPRRRAGGRIYYHWPTFFPDFASWLGTTRARVVGRGLNTAGAGSLPPGLPPLPVVPNPDPGLTPPFRRARPLPPPA